MSLAYDDPWFIAEQAKAAQKVREIDAFLAECERRWPVDGMVWGMDVGGGVRLWPLPEDVEETR